MVFIFFWVIHIINLGYINLLFVIFSIKLENELLKKFLEELEEELEKEL